MSNPAACDTANQAVVIGASVAGLLTASVLSAHFDRVLVLDRDLLPSTPEPRSMVQQEHHVHLLLQRGKLIIEGLLPGLMEDLEREGALVADLCLDVKCHHAGRWKRRWHSGITAHYCSRTLLEHVLRRRVSRIENVRIAAATDVEGLIFDETNRRVVGVNARERNNTLREIKAALVVDAGGRGSKAEQWLAGVGYGAVEREQIVTHLGYVSGIFEPPEGFRADWQVLLCLPKLPAQKQMAVVSPIEHGRWMVTAGAWFGQQPTPDLTDFHDYLAKLPIPDLYEAVRSARLIGALKRYRMPGGLRRRFDAMAEWPEGFLAIGDAVCSINPIYSQGMSASALQVDAIRPHLHRVNGRRGACRELQAAICQSVEHPWQQAAAVERRFEGVGDRPSLSDRLRFAYFDRLLVASAVNRKAAIALLRVNNLMAGPETLLGAGMVFRALLAPIGARFSPHLGETL
ncbi:NAD(P)/FAD-dependent oxidoreductase [Ensifer adhaerens]|uniref:NAD(P)/FAD-dependent oxidoreductase n=1 Tax=Ensifer adhaerens TaxID=106592 RepID=UPI00131A11E3|nr:FAD-dependent monooxygenase [Ensifer adhaerens]